jgi:Na+/melibiose symporter-like transporter
VNHHQQTASAFQGVAVLMAAVAVMFVLGGLGALYRKYKNRRR